MDILEREEAAWITFAERNSSCAGEYFGAINPKNGKMSVVLERLFKSKKLPPEVLTLLPKYMIKGI